MCSAKEIISFFKIPKIRSPKHLAWVASQHCFLTGAKDETGIAHHLLKAGGHSLSEKDGDDLSLPLTSLMHDRLHRHGNEVDFFMLFNQPYLNVLGFIKEMNKQSPCAKIRASGAVDRAIERQKRIEGM